MTGHTPGGYLTHKLQEIIYIQSAVREPDWIKKLYLNKPVKDTIPFLLYLIDGKPFHAYGNIGKKNGLECFPSPFFRIEEIHGGYAVLRLLKPSYFPDSNDQSICNVSQLEKSVYFVDVDLQMVRAIQIMSPELVCQSTS